MVVDAGGPNFELLSENSQMHAIMNEAPISLVGTVRGVAKRLLDKGFNMRAVDKVLFLVFVKLFVRRALKLIPLHCNAVLYLLSSWCRSNISIGVDIVGAHLSVAQDQLDCNFALFDVHPMLESGFHL